MTNEHRHTEIKRIVHKKWLMLILVSFFLNGKGDFCKACSSRGYIITQKQDTIFGTIQIPWNSITIDLFNLIGFDFESFFYYVSFKSDSDKSYQIYYPKMISGFGFKHQSTDFVFKSFNLNYKSIFEDRGQGYRFLNLIHRGRLDLYKNVISINDPVTSPPFADRGKVMKYFEYYIYSNQTKLLWVGPNDQYGTLTELLEKCNIEKDYYQHIPKKASFYDIWNVLVGYDKWLFFKKKSSIVDARNPDSPDGRVLINETTFPFKHYES